MPQQDSNAINRVLKAHGLPSLNQPGVVPALAYMVEDHQHFTELLRACDPALRREMYESLSPHLRFRPQSLEHYIVAAKQQAEAAQLPTLDGDGKLHDFRTQQIETPVEFWFQCAWCDRELILLAHRLDGIKELRNAGWAWDELSEVSMCSQCLDQTPDA